MAAHAATHVFAVVPKQDVGGGPSPAMTEGSLPPRQLQTIAVEWYKNYTESRISIK
jgi:hypothetical protein